MRAMFLFCWEFDIVFAVSSALVLLFLYILIGNIIPPFQSRRFVRTSASPLVTYLCCGEISDGDADERGFFLRLQMLDIFLDREGRGFFVSLFRLLA